MGIKTVQETEYGVYVWVMPNGAIVTDEEKRPACISAKQGDLRKIQMLQDAMRSYGIEEGTPLFMPGRRKVSDEEHERQKVRLELGLIPDEYDGPAWAEEIRQREQGQNG